LRTATAEQSWENKKDVSNLFSKALLLVIYGLEATNKGVITLIKTLCQESFALNFATKLCQWWAKVVSHKKDKRSLRSPDRRLFFGQFGLFVWIEAGKEVKNLAGADYAEESERLSQHFTHFQLRRWRRI